MHAEEQIPWKEKLNICFCGANQVHPRGAILIPAMCPQNLIFKILPVANLAFPHNIPPFASRLILSLSVL